MAKRGRKKKKKGLKIAVLIILILGVLVFGANSCGGGGGNTDLSENDSVSTEENDLTAGNDLTEGSSVFHNLLRSLKERVSRETGDSAAAGDTAIEGKLMNIYFIDVGQGDCTFIDYGETEILVDSGPTSEASSVVSYIRPMVDGNLDYVISSHPDEDHVGGMQYILPEFTIGTIIDSGAIKNTKVYYDYIQAVGATEADVIYDDNLVFELDDDASVRIIETGDNHSDTNEDSVVAWISCGDFSLLLTGDMGIETELENLKKFPRSTVLKAAHHGSSYATSVQFLDRVRPDCVIIPVGHNSYGHPSKETLSRIEKSGAKCLTTMNSGNVVISTNGKEYSVAAERQ